MTGGYVARVALLCLAASSVACAVPQKEGSSVAMTLDCAMSVPPSLRVGEPVMLHFRLGNRTAQPLYVLNWQTPLEGLFGNYLRITRDGVELPYRGPMVKRGDPEAEEYVALAPGKSVEAEVEVSLAYDMRQPGRYRIAFRGQLMDVASKETEVPRPLAQHRAVPVQCPAVETTIVVP